MYTKMYYTTQLDKPTDAASRGKWPVITKAGDESEEQYQNRKSEEEKRRRLSVKSKSLHHDAESEASNLCVPENAAARVEIEGFLFFLAGLEPRTAEDESQLHRLRNAMLHHCATHMHQAGVAAAARFKLRERELNENLKARIEDAQVGLYKFPCISSNRRQINFLFYYKTFLLPDVAWKQMNSCY
jgi:hypothetical protein